MTWAVSLDDGEHQILNSVYAEKETLIVKLRRSIWHWVNQKLKMGRNSFRFDFGKFIDIESICYGNQGQATDLIEWK